MAKARQTRAVETAFTRYELLEIVGEGGAGRVWRAVDASGATGAIKVLAPERATRERRKRFKNEILFSQRLLFVAHADSGGDRIRIISARTATRGEANAYQERRAKRP